MKNNPFFSIIIPTRDRPELFKKALESVVAQTFLAKEIIVINDGSSNKYHEEYQKILDEQPISIHYKSLIQREKGHGQSYSMNCGASMAKGKYLCFLDDDDYWDDPFHLQRAFDDIAKAQSRVDLYYTNQRAFFETGEMKKQSTWLEDLEDKLDSNNASFYKVDVDFLLKSDGFAHLNCSIFKRDFYLAIGGMDENIRYECDRDIYIRSIEKAKEILYQPKYISKHRIPCKKNKTNMSTMVNDFEKKLYQLKVYEKGILNSQNEAIKKYCIVGKMYLLKALAETFYDNKNIKTALLYAKQALAMNYTLKWHTFVIYLALSSMLTRNK